MSVSPDIRIQSEDFDIGKEIKKLTAQNTNIGAVVTFTGICRSEDDTLKSLELEHYPGMAEAEIIRIAHLAIERFVLTGIVVIHRYGKIKAGDNIVLVIAASTHRASAFSGAEFLMDFLKSQAPFWKKEHKVSGEPGDWVDAKETDNQALDRWKETEDSQSND